MALSDSHTGSKTSGFALRVSWSATQEIANNRSYVTATVSLVIDSGYSIVASASKNGWVSINGTTTNFTKAPGSLGGGTHTLFTHSQYVDHDGNGSKKFNLSASFDLNVTITGYGWVGTLATGSVQYELNTIPRASSISSVSGDTLGSSFTVNIDRKSTGFTHDVWYHLPGQSWVLVGSKVATSATFTPAVSLSSHLPNSPSGAMNFRILTYNGSTQIGGYVTTSKTVYVPASVKPTASGLNTTESVSKVSALSLGANTFVQHNSKLNVGITGESGIHGSTINGYLIEFDNQVVVTKSGVSDIVRSSGTLQIKYAVRDSRNRWSDTYTKNITVLPYSSPNVQSASLNRSTSVGVIDLFGTYITLKMIPSISSLNNKNEGHYIFELTNTGGTTWTKFPTINSPNPQNDEVIITKGTYPVTNEYQFTLKVKDKLNEQTFTNDLLFVRTGGSNFFAGYRGIASAFGKLPTYGDTYSLEVGSKGLKSDGPIKDKNNNEVFGLGQELLNFFYPVGTIYETTSNSLDTVAKMNAHFGGTWESYGNGMVTVGIKNIDSDFNVIEKVGGAKTHTLTEEEMPRHNHVLGTYAMPHYYWGSGGDRFALGGTGYPILTSQSTASKGGGQAHNNLQPYVVVYRYRRIT